MCVTFTWADGSSSLLVVPSCRKDWTPEKRDWSKLFLHPDEYNQLFVDIFFPVCYVFNWPHVSSLYPLIDPRQEVFFCHCLRSHLQGLYRSPFVHLLQLDSLLWLVDHWLFLGGTQAEFEGCSNLLPPEGAKPHEECWLWIWWVTQPLGWLVDLDTHSMYVGYRNFHFVLSHIWKYVLTCL